MIMPSLYTVSYTHLDVYKRQVCGLETGEPAEALKHLESAVKRRVPSGQLYLGYVLIWLQRYKYQLT